MVSTDHFTYTHTHTSQSHTHGQLVLPVDYWQKPISGFLPPKGKNPIMMNKTDIHMKSLGLMPSSRKNLLVSGCINHLSGPEPGHYIKYEHVTCSSVLCVDVIC